MIDGTKPSARHPDARAARPPTVFAFAVGLLVIAGTALAIRAYDPQAFTLRTTDSFEHRMTGSGNTPGHDED